MKKISLMFFCASLLGVLVAKAQLTGISGTVTDSGNGAGIPGVSIVVKGTVVGTITSIDGTYRLKVPANAQSLVFSFVGMKAVEVPITGTVINVSMEPAHVGVDEVMVMGYITQGKSEVTGSIVQVGGEKLEDMPVVSVAQALQGKIAGVSISASSGTPGSVQDVRIRGRSSVTAGNSPLYVIDGVPVVNEDVSSLVSPGSNLSSLASLNCNDIESITVLKDASATAAYGARGANGVIVITTKSGAPGEAVINFSATYGVSNDAVKGWDVLTGAEREMLFYEAIYNTFGGYYNFTKDAAQQFYEEAGWLGTAYSDWHDAGSPETDWGDVITNKNAPMQEYNLSASGGQRQMWLLCLIRIFSTRSYRYRLRFQKDVRLIELKVYVKRKPCFQHKEHGIAFLSGRVA